jgi:hypothetical protein
MRISQFQAVHRFMAVARSSVGENAIDPIVPDPRPHQAALRLAKEAKAVNALGRSETGAS